MKKHFIFSGLLILIFIMILNCPQTPEEENSSGDTGGDDGSSELKAIQVDTGVFHTVALFEDGTMKCWGDSPTGQLGYGDKFSRGKNPGDMGTNLPVVDLGTGRKAVQIAAGGHHTVVLLDDGTIKCWGDNSAGQLGYGNKTNRGDNINEMGDNLPVVDLGTGNIPVKIYAGKMNTAVIFSDGSVKCWGYNNYGQLGYGDIESRGDGADEMGDFLSAVELGTGRTAVKLELGYLGHTMALLDNGKVKCWGRNFSGELGYGDTYHRGDGTGEMGDALQYVDLGTGYTAIDISAGHCFSAVVLEGGLLKCWGESSTGSLGYGDTIRRGDDSGEMGDDLPFIDLGAGKSVISISSGNGHNIALLNDGTLKSWGYNCYGQLGYGDIINRGENTGEMGDFLQTVDIGGESVTSLATNEFHNAVLLSNGRIKCWGRNFYGQLGYGDVVDRGDNSGEMGAGLPYINF